MLPEEVTLRGRVCQRHWWLSLEKYGGLTRGRGITDQQSLAWLLSMPLCAEVTRSVQDVSVAKYSIGEQNKDMTKVRQHRDMKYTHTLLLTLSAHLLREIMTAVNVRQHRDMKYTHTLLLTLSAHLLREIMTAVNVRQHRDMKYTHTLLLTLSAHLSGTSWRESM